MRIAVCDDEEFYRDKVRALVKEYLLTHNLDCEIDTYLSGKSFLDRKENMVRYDVVPDWI